MQLIPQLSGAFSTSETQSNEVTQRRREIHPWTAKDWGALQALLLRSWFGRMWVLQELGVASSATVVCGSQSISWQDVPDLIGHMQTNTWLAVFGSSGYRSSVLAHGRLTKLLSIRDTISKNGKNCSVNALYASRFFDATDPRGKIYVLIGLCMCNRHFAQPDYSKDVLDVYREIALAILFPQDPKLSAGSCLKFHEHPVMSFICEAERTENKYALPSWVPDWRTRPYESIWQTISRAGHKAAGTSKIKISLTDGPNKISLAAKIEDAVHLVSSIAPATEDSSFAINTPERWETFVFDRVLQSYWINESSFMAASSQQYQDDVSRDKAFGSTLIGNKAVATGTPHQISQQPAECCTPDYSLCYWHFRQFLFKLCPNGVVNGAGIPQLRLILGQHMQGYKSFESGYTATSQGRRFFTSLGGYMGIGPPVMRPGDSICVFLGGKIPWVVRQEGAEYTLVGECYVHGIMDGEVMQMAHLPVQDIIVK